MAKLRSVNPATGEPIEELEEHSDGQVEERLVLAERSFRAWLKTPSSARGELLRRTGDILETEKERFARVMTQQLLAAGARLLAGGRRLEGRGWFYPPTVLVQVPRVRERQDDLRSGGRAAGGGPDRVRAGVGEAWGGAVSRRRVAAYSEAVGSDLPLRVASYNVRYFGHALRGLASTRTSERAIARGLAGLDPVPDLVCLQEIETISLRSTLALRGRGRGVTQLESFMAALERAFAERGGRSPYQGFYFRAHVSRVRGIPITTTGLAMLVNMERLQVDSHNVESPERITYHHIERWKDRKQTRICAHMQVTSPDGHRLHVFNTHLSLPTPFAKKFWSERARMGYGINQLHEARTLATFVRKHAGEEPFVVCGDFNSAPGSPVFRYLTEEVGFSCAQGLLGQLDAADPRAFPTAGFMRLRMHLDHLFSGGGVEWLDLNGTVPFGERMGPFAGCSDHVPLLGRFCCGRTPRSEGRAPEGRARD
jgi:endonuclease/exonuclease/phosphatase family metal-dependent hydrolase